MVTAVGISNLQFVNLNSSRNLFVIGFATLMGLVVPNWIKKNPTVIDTSTYPSRVAKLEKLLKKKKKKKKKHLSDTVSYQPFMQHKDIGLYLEMGARVHEGTGCTKEAPILFFAYGVRSK